MERSAVCLTANMTESTKILAFVDRCNSFMKLIRCLKLIVIVVQRTDGIRQRMDASLAPRPHPSTADVLTRLIINDQRGNFPKLHYDIINDNKGTLSALSPFIDTEGII